MAVLIDASVLIAYERGTLDAERRVIGAHDLWLAATCLAHGLALATTDLRDFGRVPGLEVEDWSG